MNAITTRSGVAYEGPSIHTNPSPKKVVERETKETKNKEQTNFQGSTAHIQAPVNLILILEPDVPKTLPKPNIPYPFRLNDQKLREKATNQMEKFFQIFQDLHFDISFADALLLMPKFASTIKKIDHANFDPEGDICMIEILLNNNPFQLPPIDLKQAEVTKGKSLIEEPPELEFKDLPSHFEYAYLEGIDKLLVIIANGLKDDEKEALLKSWIEVDKVDVIAKLPHPTTVKGVRSFLGHAGFYRRFIQDFSKIARTITHLLEKDAPFLFSQDCIDAFETLKKKLTEAPILVVPD
ncbi:hypothetical protein Tco_1446383 [Tanacetum coccineum]